VNRIYRALSDPTRRQILALLRQKNMTAGELATHFDITKPSLSRHFSVLLEAELIQAEKAGTSIIYHLNISVLEESLLALLELFNLKEKHHED